MASLFEELGGTYTLGADGMYYPDLELPEEETPRCGKYGRMRHTYLREYKKAYYTTLLFVSSLSKSACNKTHITSCCTFFMRNSSNNISPKNPPLKMQAAECP